MNKDKIKYTFIGFLLAMACTAIGATAATKLYDSNEVGYDNTASGLASTDVQGAIDELYAAATDYSDMQTTVSGFDERITTNTNNISTLNSRYTSLNNTVTSLSSTLSTLSTNFNSLQTTYNSNNTYDKWEVLTDYGFSVTAEKRNGVVQVTLRGKTSQEIVTNGANGNPSTAIVATLPERFRPNNVSGGNGVGTGPKIFYVPVHIKYRMQLYVNSSGGVTIGTIYDEGNISNGSPTRVNLPSNLGIYTTFTYVTSS